MKKFKTILLALICLIQIKAVFAQINEQDYNITGKVSTTVNLLSSRKYILGSNDVISISIYNIPEFDQKEVRVQPDGKIIITPLGSLKVAGMTLDDLHELLIEKYKYYIKDPQVSVKLESSRPFIVYVSGAVINPGSYELNTAPANANNVSSINKPESFIERKTPLLTNVLVAAGGIKFDSDLEHVKVTNSIDNSSYEVNLLNLVEKGDSSQDVYLMAGDTVYVPSLPTPLAVDVEKYKKFASATFSPIQIPVKVYGYVNNPGLVKLAPGESLNLSAAITLAGGYLHDSAYAPRKVFISRADKSGKLVTKAINPTSNDITLMPNDIVYVPEKIRPLVGKTFDYLARTIAPFDTFASTYNNWNYIFDKKTGVFVRY